MKTPKIKPIQDKTMGRVWELCETLEYGNITVPKHFRSDGCSVPKFLWKLIFPPSDIRAIRAGILHDWLYTDCSVDRQTADSVLYNVCIEDGVARWRAYLAFLGVRLFGWSHWQAYKDNVRLGREPAPLTVYASLVIYAVIVLATIYVIFYIAQNITLE